MILVGAFSFGVNNAAALIKCSPTGEWQMEQTADSVKSLFVDASGKLLGFALNGAATAERAKLAQQLPPVLN